MGYTESTKQLVKKSFECASNLFNPRTYLHPPKKIKIQNRYPKPNIILKKNISNLFDDNMLKFLTITMVKNQNIAYL